MNNDFDWEDTLFLDRQKRWDKLLKKIAFVFFAIGMVYNLRLQPYVVGGDENYFICIVCIPFFAFFIPILVFRRKYLRLRVSLFNAYVKKALYLLLAPIMIGVFVILTVVNISHIVWNTYNKTVAKKNTIEHFIFPVHSFEEYRRESSDSDEVHFFFNDKFERLPMSSEEIDFYIDQNPADYKIELKLRKGVWGHYLVEDWEVLEK